MPFTLNLETHMTALTRRFDGPVPAATGTTPRPTIVRSPVPNQPLFGGWGPRLR
jgi:hypothetical protein